MIGDQGRQTQGDDNDIAALDREITQTLAPGVRARLWALLCPRSLDQELIAGVDPRTCAWLAARARRLTSRSYRACLADGVRRLIEISGQGLLRSRIRPPASAITANLDDLRDLAATL